MNRTVKLTAKRQATFPLELCEGLGLQPGDEMDLLVRKENGAEYWLLKKRQPLVRSWTGVLKEYASNVDNHSMEAIRASIAAGRKGKP